MAKIRKKQIRLVATDEEYAMFKQMAEQADVPLSQLVRTLIVQVKNKELNDTAKAIQSVEQMVKENMLAFAKSQDVASAFLINNLSVFYETKIEKLESKINAMAPYYEEARRIFAASEARKRKLRAQKRQMANAR